VFSLQPNKSDRKKKNKREYSLYNTQISESDDSPIFSKSPEIVKNPRNAYFEAKIQKGKFTVRISFALLLSHLNIFALLLSNIFALLLSHLNIFALLLSHSNIFALLLSHCF